MRYPRLQPGFVFWHPSSTLISLARRHVEHELNWEDAEQDEEQQRLCSMQLKTHGLARLIQRQLEELVRGCLLFLWVSHCSP